MPDGVRTIEKSNSIGKAIVVPRNLYAEAKKRDEFAWTGVYVFVGDEVEGELPTIRQMRSQFCE